MSERVSLVLAPFGRSRELADRIAHDAGIPVVDPSHLYNDRELTKILGAELPFCVASEAALAVARNGRAIVVGPFESWGGRCTSPIDAARCIVGKLRKMLCARVLQTFVLIPEDESCLGRAGPLPASIAPVVHPLDPFDGFTLDVPVGLPTNVLACNQVRVIHVVDEERVKHETVLYDATPQVVPLSWIDARLDTSTLEVTRVSFEGPNGCSLILLPPRTWGEDDVRRGQHLTLNPGKCGSRPRPPALMRSIAKAVENGVEVCRLADDDVFDVRTAQRFPSVTRPVAWALEAFGG